MPSEPKSKVCPCCGLTENGMTPDEEAEILRRSKETDGWSSASAEELHDDILSAPRTLRDEILEFEGSFVRECTHRNPDSPEFDDMDEWYFCQTCFVQFIQGIIDRERRKGFRAGWDITGEGYNAECANILDYDAHLDEKYSELFPQPE